MESKYMNNEMKYAVPEMNVIKFDSEDAIRTSPGDNVVDAGDLFGNEEGADSLFL